ncbi:hypothetical protein ACFYY8_29385 [Streptosporangium sp. NPDC001559]|uniref:hypothetical protein n=1 Tax=Streptosporangium sp. NPDC001559 TaxID=3366187 RepID=UPI0036E353F6
MRVPFLTICVALLVACTACGISPSEVIGAGEPARGFIQGTPLYFVRDGDLILISRPNAPFGAAEAVELLLEGPTDRERELSLGTRLPDGLAVRVSDYGFTLDTSGSKMTKRLKPSIQPQSKGVPAIPDRRLSTLDLDLVEKPEDRAGLEPQSFPVVGRLSRLATGQIVCTIATATAARNHMKVNDVRVTVPGGKQARCKDFM